MKKEDKLLFLSELVGYDTSSFVEAKKDEFLSNGVMVDIEKILHEEKRSTAFKYQMLLSEYEELKKIDIDSMEKFIISTGKANNILSSFKNKKYLNPLFSSYEGDYLLSNITVIFDGKEIFLGDIVLKEDYSDSYKIDCVKQYVINWHREIKDNFIFPLEKMVVYPKNLPKRKLIPNVKIIYGIVLLIVNAMLLYTFVSNNVHFYNALHNDFSDPYFSIPYIIYCYLVFACDLLFIYSLLRRYMYVKRYLEGHDLLFKNSYIISKKLDVSSARLYKDILNCIVNKTELTSEISKYSKLGLEYKAYLYMKSIDEKKSLRVDTLFAYEIVFLQLIFIFLIYFIFYSVLFL